MSAPDALISAAPQSRLYRVSMPEVGILPFLASLPFLYVPKILDGDTQPWVLLTAILALFTYRPHNFMRRGDVSIMLLVTAAFAVYALRAGLSQEAVRVAYILVMFLVLWLLALRTSEDVFARGVRFTLAVWFVVGAYQYVAVILGLPVFAAGRFIEGRSGVPSLAAEPSYFGSLSILMAMYLLHLGRRSDAIYVALAVLSVLMSGSILAILFLGFLFAYLRLPVQLLLAGALTILVLLDATFNASGLTARLAGFNSAGNGLIGLLTDPSLNLRFGQIWFSLWVNLPSELMFLSPVSFQDQYNAFGAVTRVLIPTESDFVLPMAGELIYNSGMFGLAIVLLLTTRGAAAGANWSKRLLRWTFILACLVNPISIANPFLVFFVLQERRWRRL